MDNLTIVQIISHGNVVVGLSEDNKLYYWNTNANQWTPYNL